MQTEQPKKDQPTNIAASASATALPATPNSPDSSEATDPNLSAAPPSRTFEFPCRNLRSKEMYYQSYGAPDDDFSSGIYWCGRTQENFGPDGEPCSKGDCGAKRTCYIE